MRIRQDASIANHAQADWRKSADVSVPIHTWRSLDKRSRNLHCYERLLAIREAREFRKSPANSQPAIASIAVKALAAVVIGTISPNPTVVIVVELK
jgi:hypothetical protein